MSTRLILSAQSRVFSPRRPFSHPTRDPPSPGSPRPFHAPVEERDADGEMGMARAGPGWGGPRGKGRRRLWGQGMRMSAGSASIRVPGAGASGRTEGGGWLADSRRRARGLANSHCGTGCRALCRCLSAGEGVDEGTGTSLRRMRWGWEQVAPSPTLHPRGSQRTLPGTQGNDTSSPGTNCCWEMGGITLVPFRKEWVQVEQGNRALSVSGFHRTGQKVLDSLSFTNALASLGLKGVDRESEDSPHSR